MALLTIDNLLLSFGQRVLFDHVFLQLDRGERVGLVGDNGTGKTTLFKMIAGEQSADTGSVSVARGTKIGYLRQDSTFPPGSTVIDEAEDAFAELHVLSHKMRDLEHAMGEVEGDDLDRVLAQYEKLQHQFEQAGGYAWRHKLEATLLGVGLPTSTWETPTDKLSGGQRSRLSLAKVLINEPDILLLDEPTNHLDLAAIAWLEDWLSSFAGAVLLISHDRYLLDRVANRIVWLTRAELRSYPGNYSAFIQQRELQELTQAREYEKQQAHIAKQQEFIRRFSAGQRAREAQGRSKHLARLMKSDAMIDRVTAGKAMNLKIGTDQRAGDQVLRVSGLTKSFGEIRLWDEAKFDVIRGERIGIIGPNGSGKTTMLRTLLGEIDADAGEIRWGANLNIGYYDQRLDDFDPENSIYDEVVAGRDDLPDKELRDTLALMLFRGDDVDKKMGVLSGGERARVALAELLLDRPNVLLLDEPTNHLDIASCEALENALASFPGTILCVSHDRYFLQKTVGRLLVIDPPRVDDFSGRFGEWVEKQKQAAKPGASAKSAPTSQQKSAAPKPSSPKPSNSKSPATTTPASKPAGKKPADNPYKRQFGRLSIKELEKKITDTEIELAELQSQFGDSALARDPSAAKKLQWDFDKTQRTLRELEQEYFTRSDG